jgi:hypothetical protein
MDAKSKSKPTSRRAAITAASKLMGPPFLCCRCAVGLAQEYRQLFTERKGVRPHRMVHTDRYLFVGDVESILVYSLERNWAFVRAIGSEGTGAGQFSTLMGICVYRDRLIVCDYENNRLQIIDISAADAKDWRLDVAFGSLGTANGQFQWPLSVCETVACCSSLSTVRVQTFTIAVNDATNALTLTPRSIIGGFAQPSALFSTQDEGPRVFVADDKRISCIDVESGAVHSFVGIRYANAMCLADGLLYAVHDGSVSVIHAESGAIEQSAVKTLHGRVGACGRHRCVPRFCVCF